MTLLAVNIDHVATLRNQRFDGYPEVFLAYKICTSCSVEFVTVHLREDRRHIVDSDVTLLCSSQNQFCKINLEIAPTDEMLDIAIKNKPFSVCLVPEKREELTTEGGLDVIFNKEKISRFVSDCKKNGIITTLFVDPDLEQIQMAKHINVDKIEIHTGHFAKDFLLGKNISYHLEKISNASQLAQSLGLEVHAGHGLTFDNVVELKKISQITLYNIGHFIISDAVFNGLENSIKKMQAILV